MEYYQKAAATAEKSPERQWLLASVLTNIATLTATNGDYVAAGEIFQTVLSLARETCDRSREASALEGLADVAEFLGRPAEAYTHLSSALAIAESLRDRNLDAIRERLHQLSTLSEHGGGMLA